MNPSTPRVLFLLISAAVAMPAAASSSTPTCPVPNGVTCMSTAEVYRATNGADKVTSREQGELMAIAPAAPAHTSSLVAPPKLSGPVAYRPAQYAQLTVQGDALMISNTASQEPAVAPAHDASARPEPYRVPAQIMLIYVAPWQDEQGDLHLPERVVTEIEPRHWALGAPAPETSDSFHLLELPGEAAKDSQPAVPANTASGQSGK